MSSQNNTYIRIPYHGKFWQENSVYDMKWGAQTLGAFPHFVLLLDF
jgi:hypothetical protein